MDLPHQEACLFKFKPPQTRILPHYIRWNFTLITFCSQSHDSEHLNSRNKINSTFSNLSPSTYTTQVDYVNILIVIKPATIRVIFNFNLTCWLHCIPNASATFSLCLTKGSAGAKYQIFNTFLFNFNLSR